MYAHAQLHLVRPDGLVGAPGAGAGEAHAVQRDAHGGEAGVDLARRGQALVDGARRGGHGAQDLVHEHRPGEPPPADLAALAPADGDVVGHDDHLDPGAEAGAQLLGGLVEVEDVAGVVFDDQDRAGGAPDGAGALVDLLDAGRREEVARDRGGQHAAPDVHGVGGLVARAAAGDQGHVLLGLVCRVIYDCSDWSRTPLAAVNMALLTSSGPVSSREILTLVFLVHA